MGLAVLAHQGGWDEALLVACPVLLFAGIVWQAKRRAVRQSRTGADDDERDAGHGAEAFPAVQAGAGDDE